MSDFRSQQRLKHLLWRAGFGPASAEWSHWHRLPQQEWWPTLRRLSQKEPGELFVTADVVKGLFRGIDEFARVEELSPEERRRSRAQNRDLLQSLNLMWLEEMVYTAAQLREKVALFWHGHFASRNLNVVFQQDLLHVIRTHALGHFGDLLRAVSKSAAMLAFLNNQQNRKGKPNENFAREVMELFTLGRGHYTEQDVKEAARAFTGWGFNLKGQFVFREQQHDKGTKTILGYTGHFTGDDVLDILLEQRQTAYFIAQKMYRFFVHDEKVPEERVRWLGDRFYDGGYDIGRLLDDIFTSEWFYEAENIGTQIKSPVLFWVGMRRALPVTIDDPEAQLLLQRALGQVLFHPPNVAGWPGGRAWIDATTLMLRLRLPHILAANEALDLGLADDDDVVMGEGRVTRLRRRLSARLHWEPLVEVFASAPTEDLLPALAQWLWQMPVSPERLAVVRRYINSASRDALLRTAVLQLMATPEYQLC